MSDTPDSSDEELFRFYMATERARRDILFLYRTLCDYGRLFEDLGHESGEFDPLRFIDLADDRGFDADATRLLREGSAIAVLCRILQHAAQGGYPPFRSPFIARVEEALRGGRLAWDPRLEEAVRMGLASPDALQQQASALFRRYVLGYFADLVRAVAGRSAPHAR
ncbi:MAG: hypothetical protein U1F22_10830 [Lysobacterales bacterium]